jgi:hypothetical protein
VPEIYQLFVGPDDIQDEEQKPTEKVERYRWYPVAQVAVTYRFQARPRKLIRYPMDWMTGS